MKSKIKLNASFLVLCCLVCLSYSQREQPPIIDLDTEDFINSVKYATVDKEEILGCSAKGNPTPQYEWQKDGQDIDSEFIQIDPITGELRIASFTRREVGKYQCLAWSQIAGKRVVAMSPYISVEIAYINSWDQAESLTTTVDEGQPATLTCDNVPDSNPPGLFKWYRQTKKEGQVILNERIAIDQEGSLHFANVKMTDDLGSQEYKCAVSNRQIDTIKLGSPKKLNVRSASSNLMPPFNTYRGTPKIGYLYEDVDLQCVFSGNPAPMITWKDVNQNPIVDSARFSITDSTRVLTIKNIQEDDEGTYTCTGTNSKGNTDATIDLDVKSKPIWVNALTSQVVPEGKDATFLCQAKAIKGEKELDRPRWLENGAPIAQDKYESGKYVLRDLDQVLVVTDLKKPDDVTCFQCYVSNDVGEEFDDGCLDIILPIVITRQPPKVQEIFKGETVNLTVTATTDPSFTLTYNWYFLDNSYKSGDAPPYVTFDPDTNEAFIKTSDLSLEDYKTINGTYIREVFHKYEKINITMEVFLKEVGIAGPATAAAPDLWWIALVLGILFLIIVIVIIFVVCRRKAQEGVYPLDKKERANDLDPEKDLADSGFSDLSRADYDGPEKKGAPLNFTEEPLSYEDNDSLDDYGEDVGKFNEDGSFIGVYMDKKTPPATLPKPGNETSI